MRLCENKLKVDNKISSKLTGNDITPNIKRSYNTNTSFLFAAARKQTIEVNHKIAGDHFVTSC